MKPSRLVPAVLVLVLTGACGGNSSPQQDSSPRPEVSVSVAPDPEDEIPAGERLDYPAEDVKWQMPPKLAGLPEGVDIALLENNPQLKGPFTVRLRFPAGARFMPHTHPATSRISVISGTMNYGMGEVFDESASKPVPAGGSIIDMKEMAHFVWFADETVVQLRGMGPFGIDYVNPADDPRKN